MYLATFITIHPFTTMQRSKIRNAFCVCEAFSNVGFFSLADRFLFKNNGVLFENDLLQIGVKSEFRHNLGRLGLFYGNKTQVALEVSREQKQLESLNRCFH